MQTNGIHGVRWDGRNNFGNRVTLGIYFYQLQTGKETLVKKMVYSGGLVPLEIKNTSGFWGTQNTKSLKKPAEKFYLEGGTYTVEIRNGDSTSPWIIRKETNDMVFNLIQHSTSAFKKTLSSDTFFILALKILTYKFMILKNTLLMIVFGVLMNIHGM